MIKSWKFLLRSDLKPGDLSNVNFSLFGLGDSSYAKFNVMATKLANRLTYLGAKIFHPYALGDY